ncbi:hypothetical protein PILCRDRAFT_814245, partial [Piloderma croceum F 1598]
MHGAVDLSVRYPIPFTTILNRQLAKLPGSLLPSPRFESHPAQPSASRSIYSGCTVATQKPFALGL